MEEEQKGDDYAFSTLKKVREHDLEEINERAILIFRAQKLLKAELEKRG